MFPATAAFQAKLRVMSATLKGQDAQQIHTRLQVLSSSSALNSLLDFLQQRRNVATFKYRHPLQLVQLQRGVSAA